MNIRNEVTIVIAEDDPGHASLIVKNLHRAGISNEIVHCKDGQETLDFFLGKGGKGGNRKAGGYLLLLDIRMPKVDGITVLLKLKKDEEMQKMPVIMLTTTDDPLEVEKCHKYGCSNYITKPVEYEKFIATIRQLGLFLTITQIPRINGN